VEQWQAADEDAIIADHNSSVASSPEKPGSAGLAGATTLPDAGPGDGALGARGVGGAPVEGANGAAGSNDKPPMTLGQRMRHLMKEWWHHRHMAKNKEWGMDPYVRVRIGRHGTPARTMCIVSRQKNGEDFYLNPTFTEDHEPLLVVRRSPGDKGELIIEVFDEGMEKDRFVGACHRHLADFIRTSHTSTEWQPTLFHILDHQLGEVDYGGDEQERDAGCVRALVKWEPNVSTEGTWKTDPNMPHEADGCLKVLVQSCSDLRDVSSIHICEMSTFADTGSALTTTLTCGAFVVGFSVYFAFRMDWGILDSLLFVITSFSTVGYGDHPSPLESVNDRFTVTVFIVLGMGVLGVTLGTVVNVVRIKLEQTKRKAREKLLKTAEARGIDTSDWTEESDLKVEVIKHLKKKYPGRLVDEHLLQKELGKAILNHFWWDEIKKVLVSLMVLGGVLSLGTGFYYFSEADTHYPCTIEKWSHLPGHCICDAQCHSQCPPAQRQRTYRNGTATYTCMKGTTKGLGVIDALYLTVVTASTVGYGDLSPRSYLGKWFSLLYIPMAVGLMSKTIMSIALIPSDFRNLKLESFVLDQFGDELSAPDFADLKASVNLGPDNAIRKNDFTLAMLIRLGRVGKYDITRIEQIFDRLDKDKNGKLETEDLQDLLAIQRQRLAKQGISEHNEVVRHEKIPNHIWTADGPPLRQGDIYNPAHDDT
jgi:hypothetical protein